MGGFEVDAEELKAAATALRALSSAPSGGYYAISIEELQRIRNTNAMAMISSLVEKSNDNLTDCVTVILALGEGLEKVAMNYGLADVWNSE